METAVSRLRVREGGPGDQAFVLETSRRLAAFDPPAWRPAGQIVAGEGRTLEAYYAGAVPGAIVLVCDLDGRPAGFAFLEESIDYFTLARHGHIGMLAVADGAEGQGVGGALLAASEAWARERGFDRLTLNVFATNTRAQRLYERHGYGRETIKYVKPL